MDTKALRAMIAQHEGRRATAYKDSKGKVALTDAQIDRLLDADIAAASADARRCVSSFDTLPESAQRVVVDMIFNLGAGGFAQFKKMIAALDRGDLHAAADEMQHSAWYAQVKTRGIEDVALMRTGTPAGGPTTVA